MQVVSTAAGNFTRQAVSFSPLTPQNGQTLVKNHGELIAGSSNQQPAQPFLLSQNGLLLDLPQRHSAPLIVMHSWPFLL